MECIQWNSRALPYRNSWTFPGIGDTLVHTLVLIDRGDGWGTGLHSPVTPLTVRPGSDAQSAGCGPGRPPPPPPPPPPEAGSTWFPLGPPLTVYLGQSRTPPPTPILVPDPPRGPGNTHNWAEAWNVYRAGRIGGGGGRYLSD